ncbi:MAG: hypothetical protein A2157_08730 [Deltaproteobacteria bacterium RBG_16_47_11]|nr:MAG: hypothetical protein A2157_08730 [Deltaproteobacteria bacterium RBG_16_47_11]
MRSYSDSFAILGEQGMIPETFVATLRRMVQFRNRLVHLYWEVEAEIVYELLQKNLDDFDLFARYVLDFMAGEEQ